MTSTNVRRHTRSVTRHASGSRRESRPSLMESTRMLLPRIRELSDRTEAERAVPAELVQEMVDAGLFRMGLPHTLGGLETDPVTAGKVIEELAAVDGSVGWVVMLANQIAGIAGFLEEPAARAIFEGADIIIAGSFRPVGRAVPVEGGYRVSGRSPFASGSSHATWFVGECMIIEDGQPRRNADGQPVSMQMLFPRADCTVHDTWHTLGLRGTASHDFSVEDVFVPAERTLSLATAQPWHPWPLLRCLPLAVSWSGSHALGLARAALAEVIELAQTKVAYGGQITLREHPRVQAQVAEARALIESAQSYLYGTLERVWAGLIAGREATADQRAALRLATSHAVRSAVQAVDVLQSATGTALIFQDGGLERRFRDLRTASTHGIVSPVTFEAAGRVTLGLEAGMAFF